MGPRLVTAEVPEAGMLEAHHDFIASMGPRLVTAEVYGRRARREARSDRFNGAAVGYRGSHTRPRKNSGKSGSLQWGRGWLPRKSRTPRAACRQLRSFNGAAVGYRGSLGMSSSNPSRNGALQWGRGWLPRKSMWYGLRTLRTLPASMGPRLVTAEVGSVTQSRRFFVFASMGPRLVTAEVTPMFDH